MHENEMRATNMDFQPWEANRADYSHWVLLFSFLPCISQKRSQLHKYAKSKGGYLHFQTSSIVSVVTPEASIVPAAASTRALADNTSAPVVPFQSLANPEYKGITCDRLISIAIHNPFTSVNQDAFDKRVNYPDAARNPLSRPQNDCRN